MSEYVNWPALFEVIGVGLLVGAGLPALFALGLRALAGSGSRNAAGRIPAIRVAGAFACFAVVFGAIFSAIFVIGTGNH
jgi:hypothetical protein